MFYHRFKSYKDIEMKVARASINRAKGVAFLDMQETELLDAMDHFKYKIYKNGIPDFPSFIQYNKQYLTLSFELLKAIHGSQKETCDGLLSGKLTTKDPMEYDAMSVLSSNVPTPNTPGTPGATEKPDVLEKINQANWSYWVQSEDGAFKEPIDDLECIYIYIRNQQRMQDKKVSPKIMLPDMILDIEKMTAVLNEHPDEKLLLKRSEFNDRTRITKSKKAIGDQFDISNITEVQE